MLNHWLSLWFTVFGEALLAYFLILNSLYLVFAIISFFDLQRHRRRWTARDLDVIVRSPATPPISLIVPAYNEAATIGQSLRALLLLNYPEYEVVVVNDGSTDDTLQVAIEAFGLVHADAANERILATQPVRGVYRSLVHRELLMIDKGNGGKADAINAGVNAAKHPLVCVIDADSLLEEHALTRAVLPFLEDPTTIASGGIIRIANGCRVEDGRVTHVGLPGAALACFQITEYLRAFLVGRVAQSVMNGLLIISGAFGLFRRDALLSVGGFRTDTVGEDMEVVVRLHRSFQERGEKYRIVFRPDPVCWTEVPEQLGTLARQRNRWQRGTLQTLHRHRRMLFNPNYGVVGMLATPFFLIFEALAPLVEAGGYVASIIALTFGWLDWRFAQLLFLAAVVYGALISVAAVILEEVSFRRYPRVTDLLKLALYGVLENFGYRQLTLWWRLQGTYDFLRGRAEWGTMVRRGFANKRAVASRVAPLLVLGCLAFGSTAAGSAQTPDLLGSARTAATTGHRTEALDSLRLRLDDAPRDVDARLLYGLILSWEGRYDEARQALQQVLVQSPAYVDARIALMNVSYWSGRASEARDAADAILADDPGNRQARDLRDRLDAASRPWWAGASYGSDSFSDDRQLWHEYSLSLTRLTPHSSVVVRANEARRFGLKDQMAEIEFYPKIRPGTYAFVGLGGDLDSV
ncbi:MAG: glycosyltransferase, partial [Vicinamibacterales bacterium]